MDHNKEEIEDLIQETKLDYENCIKYFEKYYLIKEFDSHDHLIKESLKGSITHNHLRPLLWRIFLEVIKGNDFIDWIIQIFKQRKDYKTKLKMTTKKKLTGDPLGGLSVKKSSSKDTTKENDSSWGSFYEDNEIKKIINLDISRTYQERALFHNEKIQKIMSNILFIFAKENKSITYKQGMNELLAVMLLSFKPYYFKIDEINTKHNKTNIDLFKHIDKFYKDNLTTDEIKIKLNFMLKDDNYIEAFYLFFHDEKELESDLYHTFDNLMNRGIKEMYDNSKAVQQHMNKKKENEVLSYKQKDLFEIKWENEQANKKPEDNQQPLQKRCNEIIYKKLKLLDLELYEYLNSIEINCMIFLQRWIKCLFNRELNYEGVILFWDAIFANEYLENQQGISECIFNNINMVDYLCVGMICTIREELIYRDQNECFMKLFKYPNIENPSSIINLAMQIKDMLLKKLGKIGNNNTNNKEKKVMKIEENIKDKSPILQKENPPQISNEDKEILNDTIKSIKKDSMDIKKTKSNKSNDMLQTNNNDEKGTHKKSEDVKRLNKFTTASESDLYNKLQFIYKKYNVQFDKNDKEDFEDILELLEMQIDN